MTRTYLFALLAVVAACRASDDHLSILLRVADPSLSPSHVQISWIGGDKTTEVRLPSRGELPAGLVELGTVAVTLDRRDSSDRKIWARGFRGERQVCEGARRLPSALLQQVRTVEVVLHGSLPDTDGDGVPDEIDDQVAADGGAVEAGLRSDVPLPAADRPTMDIAVSETATTSDGAVDAPVPPDTQSPPDAAPDADPLLAGLVGFWRFEEGSGATASDSSGNRNHGTLISGPTWDPMGRNGGALRFTDQQPYPHVRVSSSSSINGISRGVTIAAWVFTRGSGYQQTILSRQAGTGAESLYRLSLFGGDVEFRLRSLLVRKTLSPFPANRWFHLAATFDGAAVTIFVDGAPVGTYPGSMTIPTDVTPILLGATQEGANVWSTMNGSLDDVAIYSRALSAAEIAARAR